MIYIIVSTPPFFKGGVPVFEIWDIVCWDIRPERGDRYLGGGVLLGRGDTIFCPSFSKFLHSFPISKKFSPAARFFLQISLR